MSTKTETTYVYLNESLKGWNVTDGFYTQKWTPAFTFARSRTGVSNPLWMKTVKAGGNASSALDANEQTVKIIPLSGSWNQTRYGKPYSSGSVQGCIHAVGGTTGFPTAHIPYGDALSEANAKAIRQLYSTMRSVRSQFAGGIELGQLRMTMRQMVRPAEALRKLVLSHSKKMQAVLKKFSSGAAHENIWLNQRERWIGPRRYFRTKEKPELLKALAETHLEAVYGWSPLISDIRDAATAAARLVKDRTHQRFRVWGVSEQTNAPTADYTTALAPFLLRAEITKEVKVTVVYYGAFSDSAMATMAGPALSRLQDMSGLGLRDFVPTVWDLIPYSFVVDYFANVGDVLSAACTDTSVVARLTKVVIVETNYHQVWRVDPTYYAGVWDPKVYKNTVSPGAAGVIDKIYRSVSRSQTGVPWLEPRVDLLGPSSRQWLNLAALYVGGRSQRNGYQRGLSYLYG